MRIGVISDTHDVLRQEVIDILNTCDMIMHAGDICKENILTELKQIKPVLVVRGNNDKEWAMQIPKVLQGEIDGVRYVMVHDRKDIPNELTDINLVIFGHSHKYYEEYCDGVYYVNPGSCGKRRFTLPLTMVIIEIVNGIISIKKIDIKI